MDEIVSLPPKKRLAIIRKLLTTLLSRKTSSGTASLDSRYLPSLWGKLDFVRDINGVAHLYAENEHDLFAAVGYLQGKERFLLVDALRHIGAGRVCEFISGVSLPEKGSILPGRGLADIDGFVRPLGFSREADRDFERLTKTEKDNLIAFAAGINGALESMQGVYPPEYLVVGKIRPWRPQDCLLAARASALVVSLLPLENELAFDSVRAAAGDDLARKMYPHAPWHQVPTSYVAGGHLLPDGPIDPPNLGSNNWAVSAEKSSSGYPILANDPHVPLNPAPTYWHHLHLSCPSFDVQGGMFPGFPGFGFGHNAYVSWGCTTGFRDAWDITRIKRTETDSSKYHTPDGVSDIRRCVDQHKGRFSKLKAIEWEECDHGIIYPGWEHHDGTSVALKFADADLAKHFRGYCQFASAKTVEDFQQALALANRGPFDFNIVWAHKDNHIAWEFIGQLPKRTMDGTFVRDSDDQAAAWNDYHNFDFNPRMENPKRGFVCSANSTSDPDPECYEKIATLVNYEPRYRTERIENFLESKEKHDVQSFMALQNDLQSTFGVPLKEALLPQLNKHEGGGSIYAQALQLFASWNGEFAVDAVGASIFTFTLKQMAKKLFGGLIPGEAGLRFTHGQRAMPRLHEFILDDKDPLRPLVETDLHSTYEALVAESFNAAVDHLAEGFGNDPVQWTWGNILTIKVGTLFGELPFVGKNYVAYEAASAGDSNTVSAAIYIPWGKGLRTIAGSTSRFICDMANPKEAYFAHSTGPSDSPDSPFFSKMANHWGRREYFKSALWSLEEIPEPVERMTFIGNRPMLQGEEKKSGEKRVRKPA